MESTVRKELSERRDNGRSERDLVWNRRGTPKRSIDGMNDGKVNKVEIFL